MALQTTIPPAPWKVIRVPETSSTNELVLTKFNNQPWCCAIADIQTQGHGRRGREWLSPAGGLWMSATLPPAPQNTNFCTLTMVSALSVLRAMKKWCSDFHRPIENSNDNIRSDISEAIDCLGIKWPNDIIDHRNRKIAGIIAKTWFEGSVPGPIVIGIGINISNSIPDCLKATAYSLSHLFETPVPNSQIMSLANFILPELKNDYNQLCSKSFTVFKNEMSSQCLTIGRQISIIGPNGSKTHGYAVDIDDQGRLEVQNPDKSHTFLDSGEISIRNYDSSI